MFQRQQPFLDGYVENDAFEQVAIRHDLGVRSTLAVPFAVFDDRRGVLAVRSVAVDHVTNPDLELLRFVAYRVALVVQRRTSTADDRAVDV